VGQEPWGPELPEKLEELQALVGYRFVKVNVLLQAITHSSFSNENASVKSAVLPLDDNERLEFLGDAVIGLVIAQTLMELFPNASEGKLSRWRSNLVSRKTLAEIALALRLGDYVYLGRGELRTGGNEKRSILAAALEALVGALYLDGGMEKSAAFLMQIYRPWLSSLTTGDENVFKMMDKKTHLQERTQSLYKTAPVYRLLEAWGPEHEKTFRVEILIEGRVVATGDGRSKKDAEQQAASLALDLMGF
jgi:ribonuclease-3